VSLSDLINEGNLGLIRAAHKFDETKGIKFISYAAFWIRRHALWHLRASTLIYTPEHAPLFEPTYLTVGELLPNGHVLDPGEAETQSRDAEDHDLDLTIAAALTYLTPREEYIVRRSFGLDGPSEKLVEIGQHLGISRQRVQQLRDVGLRKIQSGQHAAALRDYHEPIDGYVN
jgi:RNA polymerase primary sigma factor